MEDSEEKGVPDIALEVRREEAALAATADRTGPKLQDDSVKLPDSTGGGGGGGGGGEEETGGVVENDTDKKQRAETLVQYIVLRKDLESMGWPSGAIVGQACHAATAAMWTFREAEHTKAYMGDIDNLHKVVLAAKSETQLHNIAAKLSKNKIDHKLWIEQPENIATALATRPYPRDAIRRLFGKLKLLK